MPTPDHNQLPVSNIYEVNLRQYSDSGSILDFRSHLPRLQSMGIDTLWLMPVFPIGKEKRKGSLGSYYSIRDFKDVNPEFGTRDDFSMLVNQAHELGMRVIIDWVANHAAWDNVWTLSNPDFFELNEQGGFKPPYDWDDVIQINHKSSAQQEAMLDAMKFWVVNFNIDGFRADLAHLTPLAFWVYARRELGIFKKDLIWLAETEEANYFEAFDINYGWEWMHFSEKFFKSNGNAEEMSQFLQAANSKIIEGKWQSYFTSNHDENSWNGTEYEKYGVHANAMAVIASTQPCAIPLLYSGQEIPNQKRLAFFEKDPLRWPGKPELQEFYSILFSVRKKIGRKAGISFFTNENILGYCVTNSTSVFLVLINLGHEHLNRNITVTNTRGKFTEVFQQNEIEIDGNLSVNLGPGEFLLFEKL